MKNNKRQLIYQIIFRGATATYTLDLTAVPGKLSKEKCDELNKIFCDMKKQFKEKFNQDIEIPDLTASAIAETLSNRTSKENREIQRKHYDREAHSKKHL